VLLSPADAQLGSVADDRAMVIRLRWRGWKILFTGDAGRLSEEALLESGADLAADVIVAGLHESDFSLTASFVSAVDPQVIVVASTVGSEMDRLRDAQRRSWEKNGIIVIDQARTGGITVTVPPPGGLLFQGFVDGSGIPLGKR
jgi:beta-lactamase superfamily II metal-dependent hydrolase